MKRIASLLSILRATVRTWMTTSDLAYWTFGIDTPLARKAINRDIARLMRRGHRIVWRRATWVPLSAMRAYRLISEPAAQEAAA